MVPHSAFFLVAVLLSPFPQETADPAALRAELDSTVFANERLAQEHETAFVRLWDDLRAADDPFEVFAAFPFDSLVVGSPDGGAALGSLGVDGIRKRGLEDEVTLGPEEFRQRLEALAEAGWLVKQTEWHHARFDAAKEDEPARSIVSFTLHAVQAGRSHRVIVKGKLHVTWRAERDPSGVPVPATIRVEDAYLLERTGKLLFGETDVLDPRKLVAPEATHVHPILATDLDDDGRTDLILAGCNLLRRSLGDGRFVDEPFLRHFEPIADAGCLADFTGDGVPDFLGVSAQSRKLTLWPAASNGRFRDEPRTAASRLLVQPQVLTAGDVDRDGDLDLFVGQYKRPYDGGDMPTPFYDANDGHPAYFFRNDGSGSFEDATEEVGLAPKRNRRTYSASFVDLDGDLDLDLMVVSDFAGLDLYRNDGTGVFQDVTAELVEEPHSFGMSHVIGDFDLDGSLDFYMTGMGSTTARRLIAMGAEREGNDDVDAMRMPMAFGNRMYLRRGARYEEPGFREHVNRTGWAWGSAGADFDNDGDTDIYVANGHVSGKSSRDYCTRFWCHDIYETDKDAARIRSALFAEELTPVFDYQISWNGYEHNALLLNDSGRDFVEVGYLLGLAKEFDTRAVLAEDLDMDGRVDVFMTRFVFLGQDVAQVGYLLRNLAETPGHWVGVQLRGAPGVSPIGATVVARSGERTWIEAIVTGDSFTTQHATAAHFGLGERTGLDWLEVRWPDGSVTRLDEPAVDRWHRVEPAR